MNDVIVPEVRPAAVSQQSALRIFAGKFIVDFVETLAVSLPVGVLFLPATMEDLQKLATILAVPVGSALVSALRRGWPTLKQWLQGERGEPEEEAEEFIEEVEPDPADEEDAVVNDEEDGVA